MKATAESDMNTYIADVFAKLGGPEHDLNRRKGDQQTRARTDTFYEAFLFAAILEALHEAELNLTAEPSAKDEFVFRRGPGVLRTTPDEYSYVRITAADNEYELHVDTEIETRIVDATVELDITVIEKSHCDSVRSRGVGHPSWSKVGLLLEAKCFSGSAKISSTVARGFVGTDTLAGNDSQCRAFVSTLELSENAERILSGRELKPYGKIRPENKPGLQTFKTEVRNDLVRWMQRGDDAEAVAAARPRRLLGLDD